MSGCRSAGTVGLVDGGLEVRRVPTVVDVVAAGAVDTVVGGRVEVVDESTPSAPSDGSGDDKGLPDTAEGLTAVPW